MSELIITKQYNTYHLTYDFINKMNLCGISNTTNSLYWIYKAINEGKTLLEIATTYIYNSDYDGNCLTNSTCGLFEAYECFKNGSFFDANDAMYLSSRSGIISSFQNHNTENQLFYISFTFRDLVIQLDGPEFFDWLNNIANFDSNEYDDNEEEIEEEYEE